MHLSTIISVSDAPGSVGGTGETKQFPVFAVTNLLQAVTKKMYYQDAG